MVVEVKVPWLAPQATEGTIIEWLKMEGWTVQEGEPLLVFETIKATVEVPATASGVLRRILYPVGAVVPAKATVALIADAEVPEEALEVYLAQQMPRHPVSSAWWTAAN